MQSMKYFLVLSLAISAAWGQQATSTPPAPQNPTAQNGPVQNPAEANSQQAKQTLEKTLQALGGNAYLNSVDMDQQGRGYGFYQNTPQGVGVPYERKYRYPDKERYEFLKKHDWILIHNGDKGYETTFRGTREEDPKDLANYLRRRQYSIDTILRDWIKAPGTAFFYDGVTLVGARDTHKVTLINAQNQSVSLFIDTKTFLPIKKAYTWRDPETREIENESELYDEYRAEQGINSPHVITREKNGEIVSQRFVRTVTYNNAFPDALFAPPPIDYNKLKK
ncbi:MAG: hypothetical protein JWO13_1533 [Acidobacteriales bacterium]|nr:hypothetical protein [Terriglobales bacterium]